MVNQELASERIEGRVMVEMRNVSKWFGEFQVLKGINLGQAG
jgi:ABC-type sugar transport system ATPase subunit